MKTEEFIKEVLQRALEIGADEAEVYSRTSKGFTVEIKDRGVESFESHLGFGYALRVIRNNCLGFCYSTTRNDIDSVVRSAVESALSNDPDEYLGLPAPSDKQDVEVFDPEIDSISEGDAIAKVTQLEEAAYGEDKKIKKIRKALGTFSRSDTAIVNSRGVESFYSATSCTAHVMSVAEAGDESQMAWDFSGSRFLKDVSFEEVGRNASRRALLLLGSKRISAIKAPIILDHAVAADFVGIFASLLSSDAVQKGKSLLAGKNGEKVISKGLNIIDTGLIPGKLGSRPIDDEGVPVREKMLINDGVLMGYLYNTYTARKEGIFSTGNAIRSGFSGIPLVGISNLYLEAEQKSRSISLAKMFKVPEKALYVTEAMGVHMANPVSGEFSIGITGAWIEKGEIQFPVKEAVISGNILDFLGRIEEVGDDLTFYGNIGAPSLLVGPTDISA
jgi:PmbA protein